MVNKVDRASVSLKVKYLSKVRSVCSRYKKKKHVFDVLNYQKNKIHEKMKEKRLKLKKLKLIQDKLYSKHDVSEQNNGRLSSEDECEEDSDVSLNSEDLSNDDDMNNIEAESTDSEYLSSEEESVDDDSIMNQNLVKEIAPSREQNSRLNNIVFNDINNLAVQDPPSPTLEENNGNVSDSFQQIENLEELDVSIIDDDDVEALMAMQFRDTRLQSHIREHNLNLIPREATRNDGNCWYDAIADQIVLHNVPDKPTNHVDLRQAVCDAIPKLPQAKEWIQNLFDTTDAFSRFLDQHRTIGTWTDAFGIMCQATALYVERNIHIVGTANIGQGYAFTKLESIEGAEEFPPFTVGYYQDKHYQSLQENQRVNRLYSSSSDVSDLSVTEENFSRIEDEKLLEESIFESDEDSSIFYSDNEIDSMDNNYISNEYSIQEIMNIVELQKSKVGRVEPAESTVKITTNGCQKSRNLVDRLC